MTRGGGSETSSHFVAACMAGSAEQVNFGACWAGQESRAVGQHGTAAFSPGPHCQA